jgi:enamine deaminase RidA (YjgF/YER057c/UK114 family)
MIPVAVRSGDLVLTGGSEGAVADQIAGIGQALKRHDATLVDLCLLRVFYRGDAPEAAGLRAALAAALPEESQIALTLVPVGWAGLGDGALSIEAAAVCGKTHAVAGAGPVFVAGVRRGRFLFLGGQAATSAGTLPDESRSVMQNLGRTLSDLGAGFGDVVRMNRWYHAAGTKDEWEPSARATAAFYTEPGPIATAISLPSLLPEGRSIQIELMGMIGEDGQTLPKSHSWPEGLWDWPIHLPYKHGLACGGLGFIGGQVSLDQDAQVIDPDRLDLQIARSLRLADRVAAGLGRVRRVLHRGVYYEMPEGGLAGTATGAADIVHLGRSDVPAAVAGFSYLSYPDMRVEIEAIVELTE